MIRTDYRYEVKSRDSLLCVYLRGEIDHHSSAFLREELDALIMRERPRRLVFYLSGVEFMDSAGLGLLMGRYRLLKELGAVMAIADANERILKILRLCGMERFFEISQSPKGERI